MKHIEQIINNKDLIINHYYVYMDNLLAQPIIVKMLEPNYPNNYIKEYWENKGGFFLLKNIDNNDYIHLHDLDYLEYRYKVYPITKENLGFIISEYKRFKKFYNQLVKHFISIN
ncbi:hypothetical protein EAVNNN508_00797 [Elizabethkingia anophelis]|nr:hypothetical protein EAVNVB490_01364 [Elizabethkingia anophelis]CAI9670290.1 hypothetical protein EAVNNN508_01363 [Elizabethkingia anophelis]CAI9673434.1 hypothetical protein EAVNVB490_00799 [Elizabethkingia anophelis]CAI9678817.1 hypothetical protein EAVNNN508_00797 [Elizabethkingia anophelis]